MNDDKALDVGVVIFLNIRLRCGIDNGLRKTNEMLMNLSQTYNMSKHGIWMYMGYGHPAHLGNPNIMGICKYLLMD